MSAGSERRSLRYIRLAAFLAAQPPDIDHLVMSFAEIEELIGTELPTGARFPSWWRNDEHRVHSRAWLSAGWRVELRGPDRVEFIRGDT
ncbi:MAG TPA: hypothetical protein VG408_06160 [Actinomycetota bacterium]|nr:hypothetical protein [Actinomycetota bacterium]